MSKLRKNYLKPYYLINVLGMNQKGVDRWNKRNNDKEVPSPFVYTLDFKPINVKIVKDKNKLDQDGEGFELLWQGYLGEGDYFRLSDVDYEIYEVTPTPVLIKTKTSISSI